MIKKKYFFFLLFLLPLICLAEVYEDEMDEEEDLVEMESTELKYKKDSSNEQGRRTGQKQLQIKQWLESLELLKKRNSKHEARFVSLVSRILNYDPNNVEALNTLGTFYLQAGKIKLAKIIFVRALKAHPKNSSVHSNMGVIALKENKKEEAIIAFKKSLGYRYSNYSAAANLGTLYMEVYEYDRALDHLELAYGRAKSYLSVNHPEVVKVGNNYAVALAWSGNARKSASVFEELIKNNPKEVKPILNYAILLATKVKNKDESLKWLRRVQFVDHAGRYATRIRTLSKYLGKLQ